ncbi:S8 family serine peptidase [Leucobacter weissii]|uniref:S8 family serine peptidase n=1 Tax=Leucobacter weissii TaxID=1983706 RepID=A0A939MLN8_9MICO|nr:S8 family serine peptidase [Leucobacter weissii]MBO1902190.1 S8 family serine peptidase [Leucobacter weissii]
MAQSRMLVRRTVAVGAFAALIGGLLVAPAQAVGDESGLPPASDLKPLPDAVFEKQPETSSIDAGLQQILDRWADGERDIPEVTDGAIRVEVLHEVAYAEIEAVLDAHGASDTVPAVDGLVETTLPIDEIAGTAESAELTLLRLPVVLSAPVEPDPETELGLEPVELREADTGLPGAEAIQRAGAAGSDLVSRVRSTSWNKAGANGAGVKVGIIDYFDGAKWNASRARGDVKAPSGVFVQIAGQRYADSSIWTGGSEHGVAVAETILDIAPKAKIYLATVSTAADHRAAVNYFAGKGVRIISRSLGAAFDGPGNGTGPSAQVVDYAVKKKITWINSAGNHGIETISDGAGGTITYGGYWRGSWQGSGVAYGGGELLQFRSSTGAAPSYLLESRCGVFFQGMRWNDWGTNPTDYDLYVFDAGLDLIGYSQKTQGQSGVQPIEIPENVTCSGNEVIYYGVVKYSEGNGSSNDRIELMANGPFLDNVVNAGSASQPFADSKNSGALAVGAVDVVTKSIAPYSSRGPLIDGRIKPDISAAANFTTVAYRSSSDPKGRFSGTSAATPAVAGAAALILQKNRKWSAKKLATYLRTHATKDRGAKGRDSVYGAGELRMPLLNTKKVSVKGTKKVGKRLKVSAGKWTESVKRKYQWYRNGKAVKGAKAKSYKLRAKDRGKRISVRETVTRSGYKSDSVISARTSKIKKR